MTATQRFRDLTYTMRPQDPHGDGIGLRFEPAEDGGDYPDNMPQTITVTDAQGRWVVYVPLRVGEKIVVPESLVIDGQAPDTGHSRAHCAVAHVLCRKRHRPQRAGALSIWPVVLALAKAIE